MGTGDGSFFGECFPVMLLMFLGLTALDIPELRASYNHDSVGMIQPIWNITHGGPRADEGWGVATDNEGNVYFTGFDRISRATADVFLRKFTPDGVELWSTSWGGAFDDEAFIVTVQNGFVYIGGRTFTSFSLASADMFVLKFHASNGSLVWSTTWDGGNGYDEVDGLVADGNSLYVAGWTAGASTQIDIAVLRYDENGTLVWNRSWGTTGVDEANGQIAVDENCIYVVGHYNGLPLGFGGDAVLVAFSKMDGSYFWHKTWGGYGLDDAFGMTMDSRYIYSVGITNSFGGDLIFLLKYDRTGSLIWNATWGGKGSELARAIGVGPDGKSIYISGNTASFGKGDFDVVLLKYDQDGNLMLSKTWGGSLLDQSHGMVVHGQVIYIAGETRSYGAGNEDAFLLKVDAEGGNPPVFRLSNLVIKPDPVDVGGTVSISVEVRNIGGQSGSYNVTLKIDGETKDEETVVLNPGENKTVSFDISTAQQGLFSVDVDGLTGSYTVKEKKGCIIATATYGSELSPEVQFLREFRDNIALNTFAGKNFMSVFEAWYYSFSPGVSSMIAANETLRGLMKVILYPLIWILHLAATTYSFLDLNPELGIIASGSVASSLIAIVYFTPYVLVPCLTEKMRISLRVLRVQLLIWFLSVGAIISAEIAQSSVLMMFSSSMFVLTSIILVTLSSVRCITGLINSFQARGRLSERSHGQPSPSIVFTAWICLTEVITG